MSDLAWLHVQPQLSPGLQNLDLTLNSRDTLAGTILSGSIFLFAPDGQWEIEIAATIKAPQPSIETLPLASLAAEAAEVQAIVVSNIVSESWSYQFTSRAIDNFLIDLGGEAALSAYPEFRDRRNRAEYLLSELVEEEPRLFYVRRRGVGREPGEEIWDFIIATDRDNFRLPTKLMELQKTLGLIAAVSPNGYGGLRLVSIDLLPLNKGQANSFTVPYYLCLLTNYHHPIGVPPTALLRMAEMPFWRDSLLTEEQLQVWTAFIEIEERIARARLLNSRSKICYCLLLIQTRSRQ